MTVKGTNLTVKKIQKLDIDALLKANKELKAKITTAGISKAIKEADTNGVGITDICSLSINNQHFTRIPDTFEGRIDATVIGSAYIIVKADFSAEIAEKLILQPGSSPADALRAEKFQKGAVNVVMEGCILENANKILTSKLVRLRKGNTVKKIKEIAGSISLESKEAKEEGICVLI